MFIAVITNFAVIFTSTLLFFFILSKIKQQRTFSVGENRLLSVGIGITFGLCSLVITILFSDIAHNLLVNTRFLPFILSGLLGGPIAMCVNAVFIFSIRFMLQFETIHSLIISLNALALGTIMSIVAHYKPVTFKTIHYYFSFIFIEIIILLVMINDWTYNFLIDLVFYVLYTLAVYFFIVRVIRYINEIDLRAKKSIALTKTDFLTQLPNNLALENQISEYINGSIPFEMVHLDIDLFKNINIKYGYIQGDKIISQLAQTIQSFATERNAYVARIGGDEFCYVMTNSSPANAIMEMHELHTIIDNTIFPILDEDVQISLSGSIISYPANAQTLPEIFTASNYALKMITEHGTKSITHINRLKQQHPTY